MNNRCKYFLDTSTNKIYVIDLDRQNIYIYFDHDRRAARDIETTTFRYTGEEYISQFTRLLLYYSNIESWVKEITNNNYKELSEEEFLIETRL